MAKKLNFSRNMKKKTERKWKGVEKLKMGEIKGQLSKENKKKLKIDNLRNLQSATWH